LQWQSQEISLDKHLKKENKNEIFFLIDEEKRGKNIAFLTIGRVNNIF